MIGRHYRKHGYNCANFVSDWYRENLSINIPVINEFDRSFIVWMRRNFSKINNPENDCLVLMINLDGTYHVGVYSDHGVYHNFKPGNGYGSVVKWPLRAIKSYYSKVSYHQWLK